MRWPSSMNNPGIGGGGGPWQNYDRWQRLIGVNLGGVINGIQTCAPAMIEQGTPGGDFYILCPDNAVTREIDEKRVQWAAEDLIKNRPALSRWHPDYKDAFDRFMHE